MIDEGYMRTILESIKGKSVLHGYFYLSAQVMTMPVSYIQEYTIGYTVQLSIMYSKDIVPYHVHDCKDGKRLICWIENGILDEVEASLMVAMAQNKFKNL